MARRRTTAGAFAVIATLAVVRPSPAQSAGDGFLFRPPAGSWTVRVGLDRPFAGGDVFSFVTDELTLARGDFDAKTIGTSVAIRTAPSVDLVFDVSYAGAQKWSEFRDWVDQNDQPIEQKTQFKRAPVTVTVKRYLTPRGRSIGRFAWVPARNAVYVGAGGGLMWYSFRQVGDFIDFGTMNVFSDEFRSTGWAPTVHALAGLDVSLGRYLFATWDGRYTWARANPGRDFQGYNHIDLSGLSFTTGLSLRF